ncbi:MAG: GspE/PulE family protein [Candidatus Nealsonbacteria bacterium]|nr:GspE/PulE family protein [Candidatus Nealsonbacteria bacterium]
MSLLDKLVEKGLLKKDKAASLKLEIEQSGRKEEEAILESGAIPETDLFQAKSEFLKIPLKEINPEKINPEILEMIPEETARYYQMIPLAKSAKDLEIGMVYPEDLKAQEALKFIFRRQRQNYNVFLISLSTFKNILKKYRNQKKEVGMALEELETELQQETVKKKSSTAAEFERMAEEAPITKIVAVILRNAVEGLASDVHIEPTKTKLRVRFRLMGSLHPSLFLPLKIHPAVIARIKILSNLKIDETRVPQDGRFSISVEGKSIDFRVSTFPTTLGEKVAIRILDPTVGLGTFEDLGFEGRNLEILKQGIAKPYGLVLSTGPTGSGKSTTLYAILQLLDTEGRNVVTLEDPVEYFIEGVNQSQVRPEIGYDFAIGLRHILRQDPNVIMVGEIRDEETASLAINAALTGHIVLSTLHTNNAAGVIPRLIDMKIKPYLISPALQLAIAQRLVMKLCNNCKKEIEPKPEIKEMLLREIETLPLSIKKTLKPSKNLTIFVAQGCEKCNKMGFAGRIALFEILLMTDSLADVILKEPSEANILKEAKAQGMITMKQDGILKVLRGVTTIEEVLRVTEEKQITND